MANGDVATTDIQPIQGPDGKMYKFPKGTTKEKAVGYFKAKGIGAAPAQAPAAKLPPTEPAAPPVSAKEAPKSTGQAADQGLESAQSSLMRWRPRWDNPAEILKDPTWYGRSAKYA